MSEGSSGFVETEPSSGNGMLVSQKAASLIATAAGNNAEVKKVSQHRIAFSRQAGTQADSCAHLLHFCLSTLPVGQQARERNCAHGEVQPRK